MGGLLVNTLGWRSIFVLNIPIAAMIGVVVHVTVGEASRSALPFDYVGQILAFVGVSAVVFACLESSAMSWMSPFVLLPGVAAALILGLFVIDQRRRGRAGAWVLLPAGLLTQRSVNAGLLSGFVFNFSLYGLILVYSYVFQSARGYSPVQTGLAFAPLTVAALVTALPAGRFVAARGSRRGIMVGMALSAVGLCVLGYGAQRVPFWGLSIAFAVFATGLSFSATGQTMAVMGNWSDQYKSTASSMLNTARQTGGVIGVAVLGAITSHDLLSSAPVALTIAAAACLIAILGGATLLPRPASPSRADQHQ